MCYLRPLWKLACSFPEGVIYISRAMAPKIGLHCLLLDILSPLRLAAPLAYQNVNEGRMPLDY